MSAKISRPRVGRLARALGLVALLAAPALAGPTAPSAPPTAAPSSSPQRPAVLPPLPTAGQAARPSAPCAVCGGQRGAQGAPAQPRRARRGLQARPLSLPLAALARANAEARDGPASGAFVNSALYHAFEPGRLYVIHTSPSFLTTITLRPGEKLISKAAGDTVRWVLGETEAGAGDAVQVIVLVKPMRAGLRTNIVLTTDQRTYLIDAVSTASGAYTSVLSWTYPQEEARAQAAERARQAALAAAVQAASVQDNIPIERLDFRYAVAPLKGRPPPWQPTRVFDDGSKTYIEFPPDLAVREAPPLFLLGAGDQAELVNYRLLGRYVVVDRLIERAELRLGAKPQTIVRITRQGGRS